DGRTGSGRTGFDRPTPTAGVATGTSALRGPTGSAAVRYCGSFEPFGGGGVGAAVERKAGARSTTGADVYPSGTRCRVELDSRGAGSCHGVVPRFAGDPRGDTTTNQERKQLLRMAIYSV